MCLLFYVCAIFVFKPFTNYEDATWSKDDFEWFKNEDGTDIKKEEHGSTNT